MMTNPGGNAKLSLYRNPHLSEPPEDRCVPVSR